MNSNKRGQHMNGSYGYVVIGAIALFLMGFALGGILFGEFGAPRAPASGAVEKTPAAVPPETVAPEYASAQAKDAKTSEAPAPVLGGDGRPPVPKPPDPEIERSGAIALGGIVAVCGIVIVFAVVRYLLMNAPRGAGA